MACVWKALSYLPFVCTILLDAVLGALCFFPVWCLWHESNVEF